MTHRPCLGLKETAFQVQKSIFHPVPGYMEPQTSSRQSVPVRNFWSMAAKRQFTLGFHSLGSTYFPLPVQGRGHRPQHLAGPRSTEGKGKAPGGMHLKESRRLQEIEAARCSLSVSTLLRREVVSSGILSWLHTKWKSRQHLSFSPPVPASRALTMAIVTLLGTWLSVFFVMPKAG